MQLGLVGLGRMGGNMRERIRAAGHEVFGFSHDPAVADVKSLAEMVEKLTDTPRVVWIMVPVAATEALVDEVGALLSAGDIVVDGGNSKFDGDGARAERLAKRGVGYVDVGVSGGIWGKEYGYALMVGGEKKDVDVVKPIFDALKPEGPYGYVHAGRHGAGHYAKMVHNGIEYGMMHAFAEGYELMKAAEIIEDVPGIIKSWREGSVVKSWLLDLLDKALDEDPNLDKIRGYAEDTGEGRWTVNEAIRLAVPMNVIAASVFARFVSRQDDSPAIKAIAALRKQFGGHAVKDA